MSMDAPVSDELKFYCFDMCFMEPMVANKRYMHCKDFGNQFPNLVRVVEQILMNFPEDAPRAEQMFNDLLEQGYEGLIIKNANKPYHFGRPTVKANYGYKYKPFGTFDARIIGVEQSTQIKDGVERTKDAFGHSKTSKKKDDRELIEMASAFLVDWEGVEMKVSLAMTNPEKVEIWTNKDKYLNRIIEFKGMMVGAKERVRHPVFLRFRDDKL
jgi:DNA ligase-1